MTGRLNMKWHHTAALELPYNLVYKPPPFINLIDKAIPEK